MYIKVCMYIQVYNLIIFRQLLHFRFEKIFFKILAKTI